MEVQVFWRSAVFLDFRKKEPHKTDKNGDFSQKNFRAVEFKKKAKKRPKNLLCRREDVIAIMAKTAEGSSFV